LRLTAYSGTLSRYVCTVDLSQYEEVRA